MNVTAEDNRAPLSYSYPGVCYAVQNSMYFNFVVGLENKGFGEAMC